MNKIKPAHKISNRNKPSKQTKKIQNPNKFQLVIPPVQANFICDEPESAKKYWNLAIHNSNSFNPDVECLIAVLLNTRRRVIGHQLVSVGTLDTVLCHPREVFRGAVKVSASAIIVMHNHPSGDPTPSDSDVKTTRALGEAGKVLKIDLLDHVIMGKNRSVSLRELGHFDPMVDPKEPSTTKHTTEAATSINRAKIPEAMYRLENVVNKAVALLHSYADQLIAFRNSYCGGENKEDISCGILNLSWDTSKELRVTFDQSWEQLRASLENGASQPAAKICPNNQ